MQVIVNSEEKEGSLVTKPDARNQKRNRNGQGESKDEIKDIGNGLRKRTARRKK